MAPQNGGFMKHAVEAFKLLKLHPPNWGPILVSSSWPSAQVFSGSNLIFCIFAVTLASARLGCDPKLTLSRLDVSTRGQHHLSVQVRLPGTQPFTIWWGVEPGRLPGCWEDALWDCFTGWLKPSCTEMLWRSMCFWFGHVWATLCLI